MAGVSNVKGSKPLTLDSTDVKKIGRGFLIALIGLVVAFLDMQHGIGISYLYNLLPSFVQGIVPEVTIIAVWQAIVNLMRKWVMDQGYEVTVK